MGFLGDLMGFFEGFLEISWILRDSLGFHRILERFHGQSIDFSRILWDLVGFLEDFLEISWILARFYGQSIDFSRFLEDS